MAYEESLQSISLDADSGLAVYTGAPGVPGSPSPHGGNQYHFVQVTGAHQAGLATADAGCIGVLQNKPQHAGNAATVGIHGVSLVKAGDAVNAGETVGPDAQGKAVNTGNVAVALASAGAEDELIPVLLLT